MPNIKKLTFAPIFLLFFTLTLYKITPFLKSYDLIFSLSLNTLILLVIISIFILLSSFCYVLFSCFALNIKFVLPVGILASIIPFLFLDPALGVVCMVGIIVSLLLTFLSIETTMKNYLNFLPNFLFGPVIRRLCTLIVLTLSIVYFLSISKVISEKGFSVPDSLIDTAINFAQPQSTQQENPTPQLPSLSQDQLDLLRKNPQLLVQSGLDPKILDNLGKSITQAPQNLANDLIKQTIKDQVQGFIKPYLGFVPAGLSILLFLTLQSLTSILSLLIYPLLWLTFYILERSGFIKFTQEMRPVKKMVI